MGVDERVCGAHTAPAARSCVLPSSGFSFRLFFVFFAADRSCCCDVGCRRSQSGIGGFSSGQGGGIYGCDAMGVDGGVVGQRAIADVVPVVYACLPFVLSEFRRLRFALLRSALVRL